MTEFRDLPIPLNHPDGNGYLRYPHPLTEEDYGWMLYLLACMKRRLTGLVDAPRTAAELDADRFVEEEVARLTNTVARPKPAPESP